MKLFDGIFGRRPENELIMQGTGIAPGIGIGETFHLSPATTPEVPVHSIQQGKLDRELGRIRNAVQAVKEDLERMSEEIEQRFDAHTAAIFLAQRTMLEDSSLGEQLEVVLRETMVNAEEVVRKVFAGIEERFRSGVSEVVTARADDIVDLRLRIESRMAGGQSIRRRIPNGSVIIADSIYPSDTANLPSNSIEGIVMARGSAGSHVALLAKQMGIPIVAGIAQTTELLPPGHRVVIDGTSGLVFLDPRARTVVRFRRRMDRANHVRIRERWLRHRPVVTRTGRKIDILANIGTADESLHARKYGAGGIGLFRLEKLYLAADSLPSEEELAQKVLEAVEPLRGRPITVRLLDVGGDKRLPYLDLPKEDNPFLGRRGVRLLFQYPELLRSELRALLAVHEECPIQILVPMVTFPEEVRRVRETLAEVAHELKIHRTPKVGAMIEVPAAALCAAEIAEESDFLSIGTNDLAQYTLAADRDNPHVADYYRADHQAVLALVRLTVEQARGREVCVCGDIASDLEALPSLLATGISCLSVVPSALADVKNRIRGIDDVAPPRIRRKVSEKDPFDP